MRTDISEYCRTCEGCQKASSNNNSKAPLSPLPVVSEPFKLLAMDLVGPLPKTRYLLTAMCLGTKYSEALLLKRVNTGAMVEGIMEIIFLGTVHRQGQCFHVRGSEIYVQNPWY